MLIIGITGTLGAGKGTVVDYLVKHHNFKHYSVRDYLIKELEKRGQPIDRDHMTILANEIRAKHNPSFIIEELYQEAKKNNQNAVIESIRTVGEAEFIKSHGGYLLGIDAPIKLRYERISKRGSSTDSITLEQFTAQEEREKDSINPNNQNLSACLKLAGTVIDSSGDLDSLYQQVEDWWEKINS